MECEGRACLSDAEICAEAEGYLNTCLGTPDTILLGTDCDTGSAETILSTPCGTLTNPGKADIYGSFMCTLGLLAYCPVPICDDPDGYNYEPETDCDDLIALESCGQCDYYLCKDTQSQASCGMDGYYQSFGYAYCERFRLVTQSILSAEGQAWAKRVRTCLMLEDSQTTSATATCEEISDNGFDSHSRCYIETGFCDLPLSDWFLVLNSIEVTDLQSREAITTGVGCLTESMGPDGEIGSGMR